MSLYFFEAYKYSTGKHITKNYWATALSISHLPAGRQVKKLSIKTIILLLHS